MLAVVGISSSGRADLQRSLDALGTNLLTVEGSQTDQGKNSQLPDGSVSMIERIGPVLNAAAISRLPDGVNIYRNAHIPEQQTNGIVPYAADLTLPTTVGAEMAAGAWLNAATATYPAVVLGADAASRLGIVAADPEIVVTIGNQTFGVVGILRPDQLVPELDSAALIGTPTAQRYFASPGHPTTIYLRAVDDQVESVRQVLAATANPSAPYLVAVSRPSDALAAKLATERAFSGLLLGLGAIALLVGGVGVANTMVISVLERRAEIGLRRSLGATRGQIRTQFLTESLLLATLGGIAGVGLSAIAIIGYAYTQRWPAVLPPWAIGTGLLATVGVGVVAGLYPAVRASRLAPTEALVSV
jgi:putative ABC transport system permease protein